MSRSNQATGTIFAEVLPNSESYCPQNRANGNDSRLMLYFQGVKLYIPDGIQPETLITTLRVLKQL